MDLADLGFPTEVWRAVEGDPSALIDLLRSEEPLRRKTRDALADFFEGKLTKFGRRKGRPKRDKHISNVIHHTFYGHDVTTEIGYAGWRYDQARHFIRSKGWHLNNPGWTDRLKQRVAQRFGVSLDAFENYLKRSRPKPRRGAALWGDEFALRVREKVAIEVRRKKMSEKP